MTFTQLLGRFHGDESGQDLVEYALVLAAVATAVVAGSATLSTDIANAMTTLNTKIQTALNGV
jgi:pilus assembly protein Flp/PilA